MQAQVSSEITDFSKTKEIKKTSPSPIREKPVSINYLEIKNRICKDTFHIGC